ETCDCILAIGTIPSDFNTGGFTANLDRSRIINVMLHGVNIGYAEFNNVIMADVLEELAKKLQKRTDVVGPRAKSFATPAVKVDDPISADYLYTSFAKFFRPDDIIVSET